jgi:exopolyphosphatase / guanosine-5'-triphosphate,3'-diphosphate pyrophosphatase
MVSYEIKSDNSFRAFDQRGELTRIGEGLHLTGFLGQEPIERTLRALKALDEANRLEGINQVLAIATSPIREAGNGDEFLRRVRSETGLAFRVLTGREEALFSYIGAARSTLLPDVLFFDLGGGSLEVTYARNFRVKKIMSLPVGALRLTELYGGGEERFGKEEYDALRRRILELLPSRQDLGITKETVLMGVGGTVRALAKYDQWLRDYPLNKLHNYVLRAKSISSINKTLRKLNPDKIAKIDAMGRDRAESITAGSLVISVLMRHLGFNELVVSTHGLRDGVLAEYLRDPSAYEKRSLDEVRTRDSLADWFGRRSGTEEFTKELAIRNIITREEGLMLDEAIEGFLDIYLSTRAESMFYSILNEDSFLDHRDQVELALAFVRAKAPKTSNWFYERYRSFLKDKTKESVDKLAAFIQFAEILELTQSKATVRLKGGQLKFFIKSSKKDFPVLLLKQAAEELEDATSLRVKIFTERRHSLAQVSPIVKEEV